jgi:hypothetical protein
MSRLGSAHNTIHWWEPLRGRIEFLCSCKKRSLHFQLTFHDVAAGAPDYVPEGEEEMDDNDDDDEDEMADFIVYEVGEPGLSRCGKS